MLFLAYELWPYLAGALAIGVVTGWLTGGPKRQAASRAPEIEGEQA